MSSRLRAVVPFTLSKTLAARPNGRSADFIAPSTANGCAMACAYCYVPRHKGYSNPITVFANIDKILGYVSRHAARQGAKRAANECDPYAWVYDIGENSDCSVDALISDNVRDLVEQFRWMPNAKASFATKYVNRDLLGWDPRGRTRVRFSLMPAPDAKVLDIRTSPAEELIWRPGLQQPKLSRNGSWNVRYRTGAKGRYVAALVDLIASRLLYCRVRYAF